MATSLLVISDREPLAWLLRTSSFAIPVGRAGTAPRVGDGLLLYTTRGCYRNPTRDRSLVMGSARVVSEAAALEKPVRFGDREFGIGLGLEIEGVCPVHEGVELGSLQDRLELLPTSGPWSYRVRRTVVRLSEGDERVITELLEPMLRPVGEVLAGYETAPRVTREMT